MNLVKVDFAKGHLVGRVLEVVSENPEILFVDLVDDMHRQIVKIVLDRMRALGAVAFAFVEAGNTGQIDRVFRRDIVQHALHSVVEILGPENAVIAPAIGNECRNMT